jgi:hypothetical protein
VKRFAPEFSHRVKKAQWSVGPETYSFDGNLLCPLPKMFAVFDVMCSVNKDKSWMFTSKKTRHRSRGLYSRAVFYAAVFFAARTRAHRARCAAAILLRPAAEIVRVGFVTGFGPCPLALAHRFFCARLMRLRASADRMRPPFECEFPKAASAALYRWTSCRALFSSFFKCPTAPDRFPIGSPSARNCN